MKLKYLELLREFSLDLYNKENITLSDIENNYELINKRFNYTPKKAEQIIGLLTSLSKKEKSRFFIHITSKNDVVDMEIMELLHSYNLTKAEFLHKNISFYIKEFNLKNKNINKLFLYRTGLLKEKYPGIDTEIKDKIYNYVYKHFLKYNLNIGKLNIKNYLDNIEIADCSFSEELIKDLDFNVLLIDFKFLNIFKYVKKIINYHEVISKKDLLKESNKVFKVEEVDLEQILIDLVNLNEIKLENESIILNKISIKDFIKNNIDQYQIVDYRLNGYVLQEIGDKFNLTRERIRQLEKKLLDKINLSKILESRYIQYYQNFEIEEKDFLEIFDLDIYQYNFLKSMCEKKDSLKSLDKLIYEVKHEPKIVDRLIKVLNKDFVIEENDKISKKRKDLVDYCIKKYAQEDIIIDELMNKYNQFCIKHKLFEFVSSTTAFYGHIDRSNIRLSKYGRKLRYYPFDNYDINYLIEQIDFKAYANSEISTYKILEDYSSLIQEYDIKDEYELHNLLKKNEHLIKEKCDILRMPFIGFGNYSRQQQAINLLKQINPITKDGFVEAYYDKFGVAKETVKANFLKFIEKYWYKDKYIIDAEKPQPLIINYLKNILKEDFYFRKDILKKLENYNIDYIQNYIYRELGYLSFETYIIKDTYKNPEDYFYQKYFSKNEFKIKDIRIIQTPVFYKMFIEYNHKLNFFEYQKYHFISIDKLNELTGATKNDLEDLILEIKQTVKEEFFSAEMLKEIFNKRKLDCCLQLQQSIIRGCKDFRLQNCGRTTVFKLTTKKFYTSDIIIDYLSKHQQSIKLNELIEVMKKRYGCEFERYKIIDICKETNLYYSENFDTVYLNKDEFFKEFNSNSSTINLAYKILT